MDTSNPTPFDRNYVDEDTVKGQAYKDVFQVFDEACKKIGCTQPLIVTSLHDTKMSPLFEVLGEHIVFSVSGIVQVQGKEIKK